MTVPMATATEDKKSERETEGVATLLPEGKRRAVELPAQSNTATAAKVNFVCKVEGHEEVGYGVRSHRVRKEPLNYDTAYCKERKSFRGGFKCCPQLAKDVGASAQKAQARSLKPFFARLHCAPLCPANDRRHRNRRKTDPTRYHPPRGQRAAQNYHFQN